MADQDGVDGRRDAEQGSEEPHLWTGGINFVVEVPGKGHLKQSTNGQPEREHCVLKSSVVGFGDKKRDSPRLVHEVNQRCNNHRQAWDDPCARGDQQPLFTAQRKTSTVSWMHVSKSSHTMPSTFSALALE